MENRKNHKKHLLGVILCIVIAIGVLPARAFAVEEGTVDNDCVTFSSPTKLQLATRTLKPTWNGTMEYSTDKINWQTWDGEFINSAEGADGKHYIYVRGDNNTVVSGGTNWALMKPNKDAKIDVSGNIETLRGATGNQPSSIQMAANCYAYMFRSDQYLESAPDLTATSLAENCYMQMFEDCISLKQAPALPATTLAKSCYSYMFRACNSLTKAPDLPATQLADSCYSYMFDSCYYITSAPAQLPATSLEPSCYAKMFIDCIRLKTTPDLPATTLDESCYEGMFANCNVLKSGPAQLPATELAESCYFGMFTNCWELQSAPKLPAAKLAKGCYSEMFIGCQSLTTPADISHVTGLADNCCYRMYENCINLGIYKDEESEITKEWKAAGTTAAATDWSEGMFTGTCGEFTGSPVAGTTYYIADTAPTTHIAVPADAEGGFVSINQKYYIKGKTVEATAVPYKGYATASFVARDANGNDIPIVNNAFTMPDSDVTVIATFKQDIQKCSITGLNKSYTYTGSAIEPAVTVKDGDTVLTPDVDYTISYENNINAGTAKLIITGKGDYAGSMSTTFAIVNAIIDESEIDADNSNNSGTKTGDSSNLSLFVIMGMLALCVAAFACKRET